MLDGLLLQKRKKKKKNRPLVCQPHRSRFDDCTVGVVILSPTANCTRFLVLDALFLRTVAGHEHYRHRTDDGRNNNNLAHNHSAHWLRSGRRGLPRCRSWGDKPPLKSCTLPHVWNDVSCRSSGWLHDRKCSQLERHSCTICHKMFLVLPHNLEKFDTARTKLSNLLVCGRLW